VIKGCNFFFFANTAALWAGALSCNEKNLESRTQLDEPDECASGGDPLLVYCFSLRYEFFVHYALRVEKNYRHGLDAGPMDFQFLRPRGCLTNSFRTLSLCFGVIGKTPGLISRNNFVKKNCLHRPSRQCLGKM